MKHMKLIQFNPAKSSRTAVRLVLGAALAGNLLAAATSQAVTIDFVSVSNANNVADQNYGPGAFGAVSYTYNIGKYEVSNAQYTEFLNAVAKADPNGLYNTSMSSDAVGGINRTGISGSYLYTVKAGQGNNPVVYVSFRDSMRFVNWLQNGQPTGAQGAGTTEAGVYTIGTGLSETRAPGASFWLPSENEWYKAAYYQPLALGGPSDSYWLFPMRTDGPVYSDQPPGTSSPDPTKTGNFRYDDSSANGYNDGYAVTGSNVNNPAQNYLTDVGAYTTASSYYGTYDQGGNVFEWNEGVPGSSRGFRGGSWAEGFMGSQLGADVRGLTAPSGEFSNLGFRVAGIPEPTVGGMVLLGGALLFRRRR